MVRFWQRDLASTFAPSESHVWWLALISRWIRFDLDLATSPYKVMATHASAVKVRLFFVLQKTTRLMFLQGVAFHAKLPLFASVSDDATTQVFHGMVHAELDQNTLIVPLKILRYTSESNCDGVFDCVFHPTQPWLFTAGADRSILLVCDDNWQWRGTALLPSDVLMRKPACFGQVPRW